MSQGEPADKVSCAVINLFRAVRSKPSISKQGCYTFAHDRGEGPFAVLRIVLPHLPHLLPSEWREKSLFWKDEGTEHKDGWLFKVVICLFEYLLSSIEGAASNLFEHFLLMLWIMGQKYSSIKPQKPLCGTSPGLLSPHCMVQETFSVGWEAVLTSQKGHRESYSLCRTTACVVSKQRSPLVFLSCPHGSPAKYRRRRNPLNTPHNWVWRQSFHFNLEYKTAGARRDAPNRTLLNRQKSHLFWVPTQGQVSPRVRHSPVTASENDPAAVGRGWQERGVHSKKSSSFNSYTPRGPGLNLPPHILFMVPTVTFPLLRIL